MREAKLYATGNLRPVGLPKMATCDVCGAYDHVVQGMSPPVCHHCDDRALLTGVDFLAEAAPIAGGFTLRRWLAFCA